MNNKYIKICILLIFAVLVSCGCGLGSHYEKVEKKALKYYQEKYGKDVTVVESYRAGNYGLFGMIEVKDRAYVMSDGYSVYWDDDKGILADNAQAETINGDFRKEILEPALAGFSEEHKVTEARLNATDFESYDECVFTEYYDGDIREYLKKEKPTLNGFRVAVRTEDRAGAEAETGKFYDDLDPYVSGWCDVYIMTDDLDDLTGNDWYVDTNKLSLTAAASVNFDEGIRWYRKIYQEVTEGIYFSSAAADFDLEEGDLVFEKAGTCRDLQKMIDDAYHALPVEAEENANGGYTVKDQVHERHLVLDDPEAPLYRIKMSDRVRAELDSRNCFRATIMNLNKSGEPLMIYYGEESSSPYYVYTAAEMSSDRCSYEEFSEDCLFFFGSYVSYAYGEEDDEEEEEEE